MSPFRLFRRNPPPDRGTEPRRIPEGLRLYVFGDVHGRQDLLARLIAEIEEDAQQSKLATQVVGLGDYVDRGPSSRTVVETLIEWGGRRSAVFLRGNHEQMMLDFLEDPVRSGARWIANGGEPTLASYSVARSRGVSRDELKSLRQRLAGHLPSAHALFLQRLPTSHQVGDYFFVHAGARPGIPLDRQSNDDLMWIREGFSDRDVPFEKMVIHGHTQVEEPFFGRFRINLDTAAYLTGRLCCLVLEETDCKLLSS